MDLPGFAGSPEHYRQYRPQEYEKREQATERKGAKQ